MDKKCLRSKSYDEVMRAKGRTNAIVNPDKLFLAAVKWGPTIDGKYLKRQARLFINLFQFYCLSPNAWQ